MGAEEPFPAALFSGTLTLGSASVQWEATTRGRQNTTENLRQTSAGGGWKGNFEGPWSKVGPELRASGY